MTGTTADQAGRRLNGHAPWVAASWGRSRLAGVDRRSTLTPSAEAVALDWPELRRAVHAAASSLRDSLAELPVGLIAADARGHIAETFVRRRGVTALLGRIQLVEGFDFGEEAIGTNAIGTAATLGRPVLVRGDEHFQGRLLGYTCAGAPVRDPDTGRIIAVIDLTTDSEHASPYMLPLVGRLAAEIEGRLAEAGAPVLLGPATAPRPQPAVPAPSAPATGPMSVFGGPPFGRESRSPVWRLACNEILHALRADETLLVAGEPGTGRTALVLETYARLHRAEAPVVVGPDGVEEWLADPPGPGRADGDPGRYDAHALVVFRDVDAYRPEQIEALRAFLAGTRRRSCAHNYALTAGVGTIADDAVFAALLPYLVHTVSVPTLRQRSADLRLIAEQVSEAIAPGGFDRLSESTLRAIERAPWPGNVPQLIDTLRELLGASDGGPVDVSVLPGQPLTGRRLSALEESERETLLRALRSSGGNKLRAARQLGLSRSSVYRKIAQYGIVAR